jgi:hypothetical protein
MMRIVSPRSTGQGPNEWSWLWWKAAVSSSLQALNPNDKQSDISATSTQLLMFDIFFIF